MALESYELPLCRRRNRRAGAKPYFFRKACWPRASYSRMAAKTAFRSVSSDNGMVALQGDHQSPLQSRIRGPRAFEGERVSPSTSPSVILTRCLSISELSRHPPPDRIGKSAGWNACDCANLRTDVLAT